MSHIYPPFGPLLAVVNFHHHRGPEIESWFGVPPGTDPAVDNDWSFLPFMALADGAHASQEDFTYFTLKRKQAPTSELPSSNAASDPPTATVEAMTPNPPELQGPTPAAYTERAVSAEPAAANSSVPEIIAPKPFNPAKDGDAVRPSAETSASVSTSTTPLPSRPRYGVGASVFAMSCTRQLDAREMLRRPDDVTRSTVQKSVIVMVGSRPGRFAGWRDKLGAVTRGWFMQRDFEDTEILKHFQESLVESEKSNEDEPDHFLGISLRQLIYDYRHQALVLFKCALLQQKMLFFGSKCEKICMMQFALISLIPGLIRHLEDCADPELNTYGSNMFTPSSLRTSDRNSLLEYMGLPLQIFGKGSFFGPYTPLQQLDLLNDETTKSYMVGSTNTLLLQAREGGPDVFVDVEERTMNIHTLTLRPALVLSAADRRWIDGIHTTVASTWDPENPSQPTNHAYLGSEDFIRFQFEEYLLALLSATKYQHYFQAVPPRKRDLSAFPEIEGDPTSDFNDLWVERWKATDNFTLWNRYTDSHLFDIMDPKHPTAGGLSVDDIQRRFAQQVQDLHLDTRVAAGREALNKHLATGQKKVSSAFSSLWAELEARREAQRGKLRRSITPVAEGAPQQQHGNQAQHQSAAYVEVAATRASQAHAAAAAASQRASTYLSGWGAWASEKRREWGRSSSTMDLREAAAARDKEGQKSSLPVGVTGRNDKGLTIAVSGNGDEEKKYGDVATPGGTQTLWEAGVSAQTPGSGHSMSPETPNSPPDIKSPRRPKRMSTRLTKSPKSKERIIDGIGRLDA